MKTQLSRRTAMKTGLVTGVGYWTSGQSRVSYSASPNERLDVAFVGVGGRGRANLNGISSENVVALCDLDEKRAGDAFERFPKAGRYVDFRLMLDQMQNHIDAVVISTPDHTHFHPALMAMRMGKHVYCEKPLAHTVAETRVLTNLAAENNLATQLGAQRHAYANMHRVVELVQAGTIGDVTECYAWVGGDRGMPPIPTEFPPVPSHLDWNLWLGPAKYRKYSPAYVPYKWRFWWDFGTGETGNWGCHILDIPFWALKLKYPTRVSASGPAVHAQTTPKSMETSFEFPERDGLAPTTLHWSHTKTGPSILGGHGLPHLNSGVLFVGSDGMLLCDFRKRMLYPEAKFEAIQPPAKSIPDSPGFHREWIEACKGGQPATCNFDYSGPLAETVLLGNVAYRAEGGFEWDANNLKAIGNDNAAQFIQKEYRSGWEAPNT